MITGKRKKIAIIHFFPLEQYPPVMNLIDYLSGLPNFQIQVITNKVSPARKLAEYQHAAGHVHITRPAVDTRNKYYRYLNFFLFYVRSLLTLIRMRPDVILYYETLSSWPALVYRKLVNRHIKIMVHYHEYTTPEEYNTRMLLSKYMHKWEKRVYNQFAWISQTNTIRLQKFRDDNDLAKKNDDIFHALPNYPPKAWQPNELKEAHSYPVKLVYVGSLGFKNMYLEEVVKWLSKHQDTFTLDVYAHNIDPVAKKYLTEIGLPNIRYHGGCNYDYLPSILNQYDVGIVIYKPFSENTIHAISNKVFEYLACGLDVWFSDDMEYTFNYIRADTYPKVLPVNFKDLESFDFSAALDRSGKSFKKSDYFCEDVYKTIAEEMISRN